jgi:hypothetical protein
MVYTISLVAIAVLTVPAFDPDVWLRDIDSTPSPFPIAIIFAFVFPWVAHRFESTRAFVRQSGLHDASDDQCLANCLLNCNKAHASVAAGGESMRRPPVLPHVLVRVPNAAERRATIFLDLPLDRA